MKFLPLPLLVLTTLLASAPLHAQLAAPGAPAPGTGAAPGAPGAKPKAFATADKLFVMSALNSIYVLNDLTASTFSDIFKLMLRETEMSDICKKIGGETNKLWSELAPMATAAGEKIPVKLTGADEKKIESLKKPNSPFAKEWTAMTSRELKQLSNIFKNAKPVDPQLKQLATTWTPTLKTLYDELETASKAMKKSKDK